MAGWSGSICNFTREALTVGVQALGYLLEVAELRIHDESPLANKTVAESGIRAGTGAHIVGQWVDNALHLPPAADQLLRPGMILVAAGNPDSIQRLGESSRRATPRSSRPG